MEAIRNYLETMFLNLPNTPEVYKAKNELWQMMEVQVADAVKYQLGDSVVVVADTAVGFRASLYGYLLPLLLMVVTLVAVLKITQSEGYAAVSALGILIPYYIGLYLLRNKLRNKLSFSLEPCC